MKKIVAVGIDDSKIENNSSSLIFVFYRSDRKIVCLHREKIEIDGNDSTVKIIKVLRDTLWDETKVVFISGINFAGLNLLNWKFLKKEIKKPIIIVMDKKPNKEKFLQTIKKVKGLTYELPPIYQFNHLWFNIFNVSVEEANKYIELFSYEAKIPEPIRIAHIIGRII